MRTSASIRKPTAKTAPIAEDSCHSLKTPAALHAWRPPDLESSSDQHQVIVRSTSALTAPRSRAQQMRALHPGSTCVLPEKKGMP